VEDVALGRGPRQGVGHGGTGGSWRGALLKSPFG